MSLLKEDPMKQDIALITGGSRGIGRQTALELASKGTDIILTFRNRHDAAEAVVADIRNRGQQAVALPLDVGNTQTFDDFAGHVRNALRDYWQRERFDYLLNNAGSGSHAPLAETTEAQFDSLMREHLKGPFFLTQALLPLLADGGRILNVSSGVTRFSTPGSGAYAMMKGGIEVFTRYLAKELGPRGISANSIAPGAIATDFADGLMRDNDEVAEFVASVTALERVGQPEDIGRLMATLLLPESRWANAQRVEASG